MNSVAKWEKISLTNPPFYLSLSIDLWGKMHTLPLSLWLSYFSLFLSGFLISLSFSHSLWLSYFSVFLSDFLISLSFSLTFSFLSLSHWLSYFSIFVSGTKHQLKMSFVRFQLGKKTQADHIAPKLSVCWIYSRSDGKVHLFSIGRNNKSHISFLCDEPTEWKFIGFSIRLQNNSTVIQDGAVLFMSLKIV